MTLRRSRRVLSLEALEPRALMSATPFQAGAPQLVAGDTLIPIHAQVGSSALEKILGVADKLDTIEDAVNAYLNGIPGWHLTGDIDETPSYCGTVDGSLVLGANGLLKSATMTLTGSADIGGAIEGYYGTSVLHVGLGAAADLSANVSATASFSMVTNTWDFGGSASLDGYIQGYATAMAWPLKGEVYVRGEVDADASISSQSGLATASLELAGTVGAKAQLKSLFGGWTTIANVSRNLGSWEGSASFDVGAWFRSEATSVVVSYRTMVAQTLANAAESNVTANVPTGTSVASTIATSTEMNAPITVGASLGTATTAASSTSSATTANLASLGTTYRVDAATTSVAAPLNAAAVQEVFRLGLVRV